MSVEVIAISGAAIVVVTALIATLFARRNMSSSLDSDSSRNSDDRYHSASSGSGSYTNGVFGGTRRTRNVRRSKRRF
jgi:hypothetical protein